MQSKVEIQTAIDDLLAKKDLVLIERRAVYFRQFIDETIPAAERAWYEEQHARLLLALMSNDVEKMNDGVKKVNGLNAELKNLENLL